VVLERGPLSLVSTIEELLGRNSSGSGLESREYGRGDSLLGPSDTLYPQKSTLNSPTSGGRSVGIVRSQTKANEFSFSLVLALLIVGVGSSWRMSSFTVRSRCSLKELPVYGR
jgi:hypothetical protein